MNKTLKLEILNVTQSIGCFYVAIINPNDLLNMSYVDRRRIENEDSYLGIQREIKIAKVNQIKNYLRSVDATFPNTIILNTESQYIINEEHDILELKMDPNTFTIIDGQHRLEGFRDSNKKGFDLIITIFKDLALEQQASIFSTINSQQTKVDPSLNLNLELNSSVFTPKKMMIEIAQSFNYDKESPWYKNIKLLGSGTEGIISLSAFVNPLLEYTYPESEYYQIRNSLFAEQNLVNLPDYDHRKYFFWGFYKKREPHIIYKILLNYFNAIKNLLSNDWLNSSSLLTKTTGYNAIIKLLKEYVLLGIDKEDLSYEFFYENLKPIHVLNGEITSDNFGASGLLASNELYKQFMTILKKS